MKKRLVNFLVSVLAIIALALVVYFGACGLQRLHAYFNGEPISEVYMFIAGSVYISLCLLLVFLTILYLSKTTEDFRMNDIVKNALRIIASIVAIGLIISYGAIVLHNLNDGTESFANLVTMILASVLYVGSVIWILVSGFMFSFADLVYDIQAWCATRKKLAQS